MRLAAALILLAFLAACERKSAEQPAPAPVEPVAVAASDELPDLSAPATGIAFWTHPNVAFNGLMIVASADGAVGYNIEDGAEVSRVPGVKAQGAAVSYLGRGAKARGLLAIFDQDASVFRVYTIDNAARAFQEISGGIPIRGGVRGFCFGRAQNADGPSLYVVQKGSVTRYAFRVEDNLVKAKASLPVSVPADIETCAVDGIDGSVFLSRHGGDIYRMTADGDRERFAAAGVEGAGDLAVLVSQGKADDGSLQGDVVLLDRATGTLHVFDRESGDQIGAATISATDEIEAVSAASVMGASSANLGALYRDGAIALGIEAKDRDAKPSIRLIPVNGLKNALDLPEGAPVDPRGEPAPQEDKNLLIKTNILQPQ